jgi:methylated-DNA-[protein]-cysteine S-methyltransferase
MYCILIPSPIGPVAIHGTDTTITAISCKESAEVRPATLPDIFRRCIEEFEAYFAGSLKDFTFPMAQPGTDFQQTVWEQLTKIPYGQTISYLTLAKRINNPKSIRAVGTTNGKNRLWIAVPCHRVIGTNGSLTGYAGGIWRKKWLLEHEMKHTYGSNLLF